MGLIGLFRPSNACTFVGDVLPLVASGSNGGGRFNVDGNRRASGNGLIEQ